MAFLFALVLGLGFLLPQKMIMPVQGASSSDYNHDAFWAHPWGKSGVHKGVDIFAKKGTDVLSATAGLVVRAKEIPIGGNIVSILGPKWRYHYYAHLDEIKTKNLRFVKRGEVIGSVGNSGNAKTTPPHLHYSVIAQFPHWWLRDTIAPQGHLKMHYLDVVKFLEEVEKE